MYTIAVTRDFIAHHFLIGGDWGDENQPHAHHYLLEVSIEYGELDQHGYLVDIVAIEAALTLCVGYFENRQLNDLPEFDTLNPSLEHFCRIIWHKLRATITPPGVGTLQVKLWENESCWAAYWHPY
ncbi:MAG: 6-carboxytetrahydropterin synthase [Desulfuromonadaceae bacterium]|nr:6-carboxytetrahydropterin synthase [Desulfuromonadaceae bacterium]